jgi:hypothetical protein
MEELSEEMWAAILAKWPDSQASELIPVENEFPFYPPPVSKPPPVSNAEPVRDFEPHIITDSLNWETLEVAKGLKIRAAYLRNARKVFVSRFSG